MQKYYFAEIISLSASDLRDQWGAILLIIPQSSANHVVPLFLFFSFFFLFVSSTKPGGHEGIKDIYDSGVSKKSF